MILKGKRIAALVSDGFEQVELTEPMLALKEEGAEVQIISPQPKAVRSWQHTEWGEYFLVDIPLDQADPTTFNALLLPGGVMSPDQLRIDKQALIFVRAFVTAGKPIAAICHGPWTLINAGVAGGRTLTSYPSIRIDLENAGAHWTDREVVVDGALVTSRKPDDIPAFNQAMIEVFAHGRLSDGQRSEAPNASFETGVGQEAIGDNPNALAGNWLGNNSYPSGNQREQDPARIGEQRGYPPTTDKER